MVITIDLARYILPEDIFMYFSLYKVDEEKSCCHFYLDKLNILPDEYIGEDMESKGFHTESVIKDFPLRDKALYLHVLRRRWLNKNTDKVVSRDWELVSEGTHYIQSFSVLEKSSQSHKVTQRFSFSQL